MPNIMSLGVCFKKIAPHQSWRVWLMHSSLATPAFIRHKN